MTAEIELLPCPFCGASPRVDEGVRGYPCILCGECGASSDYAGTGEEAEAIAAWNRRARPAPDAVVVDDAVVDAFDDACINNDGRRVSWHGYTSDDRIEVIRRFLAALAAAKGRDDGR